MTPAPPLYPSGKQTLVIAAPFGSAAAQWLADTMRHWGWQVIVEDSPEIARHLGGANAIVALMTQDAPNAAAVQAAIAAQPPRLIPVYAAPMPEQPGPWFCNAISMTAPMAEVARAIDQAARSPAPLRTTLPVVADTALIRGNMTFGSTVISARTLVIILTVLVVTGAGVLIAQWNFGHSLAGEWYGTMTYAGGHGEVYANIQVNGEGAISGPADMCVPSGGGVAILSQFAPIHVTGSTDNTSAVTLIFNDGHSIDDTMRGKYPTNTLTLVGGPPGNLGYTITMTMQQGTRDDFVAACESLLNRNT